MDEVHCGECGRNGEALHNSRGDTRCRFCYSQQVTPIEPAADVAAETAPDAAAAEKKSKRSLKTRSA